MPRAVALALLAAVLATPLATAHATAFTSDGQARLVVGQLDEPVVTHQRTGLDLCFTQNDAAKTPLRIDPDHFAAPGGHVRLRSPTGEALALALTNQTDRPGCYQSTRPYLLTEAGQYTLEIKGLVNGTALDLAAVAVGAVQDAQALAFPGALDQDTRDLAAEVATLEGRLARLEADQAARALADEEGRFAPGLPSVLLVVALAAVAGVLRRRA